MAAGKRYKVADGTQVHYDGKLYGAGEVLTAPEQDAAQWIARGLVTQTKAKGKG